MDKNSEVKMTDIVALIKKLEKKQLKAKNIIRSFHKNHCSDDPCAAYLWLSSNREIIAEVCHELLAFEGRLLEFCKDEIMKFENNLREAVESVDMSFKGQWPKYFINMFLPVTVNDKKMEISIGEIKLKTFSIKIVIDTIKKEISKLSPNDKKLKSFLTDMHESYNMLSKPESRSVFIYDIYRQMLINRQPPSFWRDSSKTKFKPLSELEFKANLTGLLKANMTSINDHQLRLIPPISSKDSMYIYQPSENRFAHVGRIEFLPNERL